MTTSQITPSEQQPTSDVFTDPVGFLAALGIECELVAEVTIPAAA